MGVMEYNEEITKLVCEYFDTKYKKAKSIRDVDYETAAKMRDNERILSEKLLKYFGSSEYNSKSLNIALSSYCMTHFGFDPRKEIDDNLRQRIREIKLKRIGI